MKKKGFVSSLIIGILALGLLFTGCPDNNGGEEETPIPIVTLENITVEYEQGGTAYPSTPLDELKDDLIVTANYSDGSNSTVTDYSLSGALTAGASEITVTYEGKTTTFTVIVTAAGATLSHITAEYNQSEIVYPSTPLDDLKDDLIVTAHFSDNSEQEAHGYTLSGELQIGESEITVTYEGKTTTFDVNVTDPTITLLNITAVYTQGGKTIFTSTPLDELKDDLIVTAYLSDSTSYNPTGYTLSGTLTAGTSIITASYSGQTATFNVTVTAVALSNITAVYTQSGDVHPSTPLNNLKDDLTVTSHYNDGTNQTVTSYTLSGTLTVGERTITVTYNDKTTTFNVNVTAEGVTLLNITAVYTQGGKTIYPSTPLDELKDDLTVTAHLSDSTSYNPATYTLSGTLTVGSSTITASYSGQTTTFNVNVTAVELSNITAVYNQGGKTIYPSTPLDDLKQDLIVTAHNNDGSSNPVTSYTLSGTLTVGTSAITVTYSGLTTTFNVTVTAAVVEYVTITWHLRGGGWPDGFTPVTQVVKGGTLAFEYEPDTYFEPVKNNCEFAWHWYTDRELTQEFWGEATDWPPKVIINNDLTLYAEWKQITPQFYWGNYIPSTIVQATDLAGSPVFNIDELVATVENARKRVSLTTGAPVPTHTNAIIHQGDDGDNSKWDVYNNAGVLQQVGTTKSMTDIRWQEFKGWENAVKADKAINYTDVLGYPYFVSPKEFGEVRIFNAISADVTNTFTRNERTIDGIEYIVYSLTNPQTASGVADFTMRY
ncbi:MAG: bacterial Ig-like domain-containing protein [Treponema sp.]|jgi:hypothetical protein|nr:bacterial Ig-like domain-containing protein [Treponema sp.]